MVSVIIPNREEKETLQACVESIFEKTAYKNYEIIIVENNSSSEEIFSITESSPEIQRFICSAGRRTSTILPSTTIGVRHAKGDYLLFLNNDVTVIAPG